MTDDDSMRWRERLINAALLLTALVAYCWRLGGKSLWVDEALSLRFIRDGVGSILTNTVETNPPLYYLLLRGWSALFGTSEVALRSLSVLFAMAAVVLLARLAGQLGSAGLVWVAAGLLALSPMPVSFAQMARGYSLYLAGTILSFDSLLRWERLREKRWAAVYVISTAIMLYSHNFGLFNFAAQQIWMGWLIWRRRVPLREWGTIAGAALLAFSPWLAVQVGQALNLNRSGFWIPVPSWSYLGASFRGFFLWGTIPPGLIAIYLPLAILGTMGFLGGRSGPAETVESGTCDPGSGTPRPAVAGLLLLWLLFPALLAFFLSHVSTPIFWDRYLFGSVPAAYLLIARGVMALPTRWFKGAAAAVLVVIALAGLWDYYPWQMEDWRSLAAEVRDRAGGGDVLALTPFWAESALRYYYRGPLAVRILPERAEELKPRELRGPGRLWLACREESGKSSPVVEMLRKRFPRARITERSYGYLLRLYLFDFPRRGPPDQPTWDD